MTTATAVTIDALRQIIAELQQRPGDAPFMVMRSAKANGIDSSIVVAIGMQGVADGPLRAVQVNTLALYLVNDEDYVVAYNSKEAAELWACHHQYADLAAAKRALGCETILVTHKQPGTCVRWRSGGARPSVRTCDVLALTPLPMVIGAAIL